MRVKMTTSDWLTLAGIVLAIGSGFAIPAAIWMTKMWTGQRVLAVRVRSLGGRIKRLEISKASGNTALADQTGSLNDRVNEHAEHLADHGARLSNAETEIKELRTKQHQLSNIAQQQQTKQ